MDRSGDVGGEDQSVSYPSLLLSLVACFRALSVAGGAGAGAGAQGEEGEGSGETAGSVGKGQREASPGDATGERRDTSGSVGPQLQQAPLGQRVS